MAATDVVKHALERAGYRARAALALGRRAWVCPEGHKVRQKRAIETGACKYGHPIFEEPEGGEDR